MTAVRNKLMRVMSVFLVFVMVVTMGVPMQAQASNSLKLSAQQTEESTENDTEQSEKESEESESTQRQGESEESESTQEQETSEESESTRKQEESTETETTQDQEESTEIETTQEQEESTETEAAQEQEESTETESIERQEDEDDLLKFNKNSKYAIVAVNEEGRPYAMNATALDWKNHVRVKAEYYPDDKKINDAQAQFVITPADEFERYSDTDNLDTNDLNTIEVVIECLFGDDRYPLRTEAGNNYAFADNNEGKDGGPRYDGTSEIYIIEKSSDGQGVVIRAKSNDRYATVDWSEKNQLNELKFEESTQKDEAQVFEFVENPLVIDVTFSIQHQGTGKYIRIYEEDGVPLTVDGEKDDEDTIFRKALFGINTNTADGTTLATASFISNKYKTSGIKSVIYKVIGDGGEADASMVLTNVNDEGNSHPNTGGNWESIQIIGNGDGTVSFKDSYYDEYITVDDEKHLAGRFGKDKDELTENEKFILHVSKDVVLQPVTDLSYDNGSRTQSAIDLTWKNPKSLFTGIEVWQKKASEAEDAYKKVAHVGGGESYTVTGLERDTEYTFKLRTALRYDEDENAFIYSEYTEEINVKTRDKAKPDAPQNVHIEELDNGRLKITWDADKTEDPEDAVTGYKVICAPSMFGKYKEVASAEEDVSTDDVATEMTVSPTGNKYANYYRVIAIRDEEESDESDAVSLETELFGDHTIIFADTDDVEKIDEYLLELFYKQNDYENDAQFKGEQWQIYFKPGDYTQTSCMYLGFYTSFNGLGKTPYDVKLNNIAIPAYLPAGELSETAFNATCNFWRSAENLAIINTGNEQGKAGFDCFDIRSEHFNWAVAQAAPLRRVYSERPVSYDWNYGWASGGYVADCLITGSFEGAEDYAGQNLGAGTFSGQQFFTRNSKILNNTFGTTLNNFFMGVEADNNLTDSDGTGKPLQNNNGYTNWGIAKSNTDAHGNGDQQVITEITRTPKISEKPFLYLDDDEYKVFVPSVQENVRGITWGDGKENSGMGKGTSISLLDNFYIAKPGDTAAKINEKIKSGKNIYFTPGTYHAEEPIVVDRENAILLGTGMASIIPDNSEMAMYVGDKNGIRIEGLIFDAGASSRLLLEVGENGVHTDHSANPIILQDLFFRVGGTTDTLTKADDALQINSDDVIGDHFWIWRADHGAGVEWYGNESKHGLIVNGDDVTCYALFNEHFQEYHTLWNGENGATYFYQNETCYDPISQDAWMSHGGGTKGYSSYKVSNDVTKHYAVGLGIYNVFIYTGPSYDASGIGIELDNAIEVPNSPGVLVENACTQTFANSGDEYPLCKINHIVNGVGGSVSSGRGGEGWSRKFLLYYRNGAAEYGKETNGNDPQKGKFIGTEIKQEGEVAEPADETISLDRISMLYNQYSALYEGDYTATSWLDADLQTALEYAYEQIEYAAGRKEIEDQYSQSDISDFQTRLNKACSTLEAAYERLIYIGEINYLLERYKNHKSENYTDSSWKPFDEAMVNLYVKLEDANKWNTIGISKQRIYAYQVGINEACNALKEAAKNLDPINPIAVTGVTLSNKYLDMKEGTTSQLMAYVVPGDATNSNVTWSSSASDIAEVDENGMVTANKEGNAVIKVITEDGRFSAECIVTVTTGTVEQFVAVTEIQVIPEELFMQTGSEEKLQVVILPENATSKRVIWSSDNEEIVTVDEDGNIRALSEGTATITVTDRDGIHMAHCVVTISDELKEIPVEKVTLDKESCTLQAGESVKINAEIVPENATNKKVTWSSSNEEIAAVDINGNITAVSEGTAVITVTTEDGGYTADCLVTVTGIPVTGVTLTSDFLYLRKGEKRQLQANIEPESAANQNVTWGSSDEKIATVDQNGVVKAIGQDKTTTTITVTTEDGAYKAECVVYVGFRIEFIDGDSYPYTGKAIKPQIRVYDGDRLLTEKKDYTVSYKNNTKADYDPADIKKVPTVSVKGKGNYSGTAAEQFEIRKADISTGEFLADNLVIAYKANKAQKPVPKLLWNGKSLKNKKDYTFTYYDKVKTEEETDSELKAVDFVQNEGTYQIELAGCGNFTGTRRINLTVSSLSLISKVSVSKIKDQPYTGEPIPIENLGITVKNLTKGTDYEVYYDGNNTNIGTAYVVIEGKGAYIGTKRVSFRIVGTPVSKTTVEISPQTYNGKELEPEIRITSKVDGKVLIKGEDYTIKWEKNLNAGSAAVIVTGINRYSGTLRKTFKIQPYSITGDRIAVEMEKEVSYAKGGAKPGLTVTFREEDGNQRILTEGTDYTVAYKKNTSIGDASLIVKGKGNFKDSAQSMQYKVVTQDISNLFPMIAADKAFQNKKNNYVTKITIFDLDGKELKANKDYDAKSIEYYYEKDASGQGQEGTLVGKDAIVHEGTVIKAVVKGKGCYTGKIEGFYQITPQDFSKAKIKIYAQEYTGDEITLDDYTAFKMVKVGQDDITDKFNEKYEIVPGSYRNNTAKGTASVMIRGKDGYGGVKTVKFKITTKKFIWLWNLLGR